VLSARLRHPLGGLPLDHKRQKCVSESVVLELKAEFDARPEQQFDSRFLSFTVFIVCPISLHKRSANLRKGLVGHLLRYAVIAANTPFVEQ
jgi:hypothetical protein